MPSAYSTTVLIPARQAANTIGAAMASLRAQTLQDFTVVLVDDGCSDDTIARARAAFACDARLQIVNTATPGLVPALQSGLAACNTPWVARFDADDVAHHDRLAAQHTYAAAHPHVDVVGCQVETFVDITDQPVGAGYRLYDSWHNALVQHADIVRARFIESPLAHPTVLMKRSTLLQAGGYRDADWPEDYDLWLRLAAAGAHFGKVPQVLHRWRDHPTRASRTQARYRRVAFWECKAYHLAHGPLQAERRVLIWGAGRCGRLLSRLLEPYHIETAAFIDVDVQKIGGVRRGGVPVIAAENLASFAHLPLLAAVGNRGARELIRQAAEDAGWRDGETLWCVA